MIPEIDQINKEQSTSTTTNPETSNGNKSNNEKDKNKNENKNKRKASDNEEEKNKITFKQFLTRNPPWTYLKLKLYVGNFTSFLFFIGFWFWLAR